MGRDLNVNCQYLSDCNQNRNVLTNFTESRRHAQRFSSSMWGQMAFLMGTCLQLQLRTHRKDLTSSRTSINRNNCPKLTAIPQLQFRIGQYFQSQSMSHPLLLGKSYCISTCHLRSFHPEDGGDIFFQNIALTLAEYKTLYECLKRWNPSQPSL